jgi:hypothetical protein
VAVEQILAGIDIERRPGFRMQRAESHKLLSHPDAARPPVAALQILQQRNPLFELFQILAHGVGVPSKIERKRRRAVFPGKDGGWHKILFKSATARSDAEMGKRWAMTTANRRGEEAFRSRVSSHRSSGLFVVRTKKAAEKNPDLETSGGAWMGPLRGKDL